ncbi:MAG: hypothetical protein ACRCVA_21925, partial [Phreatobacter sp.]
MGSGGRTRGRFVAALAELCLIVPLCLLAAAPPSARAQALTQPAPTPTLPAKADISASTDNGYARVVFGFNQQLPSEVKVSGGVLIVTFSRPVALQTDALSTRLAGYVSAVRRDPDGRSLRFALAQRVTVNSMEAGERLFVDMLPDSWRGAPPALPAEVVEDLTRRARDAERRAQLAETQRAARVMAPVVVRVGNHPTFTRFVLTLPEPVGVSLDRAGDRLSIRVGKPFTADLRQTREGLPHFVSEIEANTGTDELLIRLTVQPEADVRAFREEGTYVVDLSMRDPRATTPMAQVPRNDARPAPSAPPVINLPGNGLPIPIFDAAAPAPRLAAARGDNRPAGISEVIPAPAPAGVETAPVAPLNAEAAAQQVPPAPPAAPARAAPPLARAMTPPP